MLVSFNILYKVLYKSFKQTDNFWHKNRTLKKKFLNFISNKTKSSENLI